MLLHCKDKADFLFLQIFSMKSLFFSTILSAVPSLRPSPPSLPSVPLRRPFPYARIRPVRLPARHLLALSLHFGRKSAQILPKPPVFLHFGRKSAQILPEPPVFLHFGRKSAQNLPEPPVFCIRAGKRPKSCPNHQYFCIWAGNRPKICPNIVMAGRDRPSPVVLAYIRLKHIIIRLKHIIFFYDGCSDDEG